MGQPPTVETPTGPTDAERARVDRALRTAVAAVAGLAPGAAATLPPSGLDGPYGLDAAQDVAAYRQWLALSAGRHRRRTNRLATELAARDEAPVVTVVVEAGRPDVGLVRRCVASVAAQAYPRWQLVVRAGGDLDPAAAAVVTEAATADPRVVMTGEDTAAVAHGELVVFLGPHDELGAGALAEVAAAAVADPEADVFYTDEDRIGADGARSRPAFKPGWSPDLLLSTDYLGGLLALRRLLWDEVGGGGRDYDLVLRATERARRVVHLPVVAYHRRDGAPLAAGDPPTGVAAAQDAAALAVALARRGDDAVVEPGRWEGSFRVRRAIRSAPLVSIVVPFRDGAGLLGRCVASLHASGYAHWEAILVDNGSWEPETRALRRRLEADARCRVLDHPGEFNWSAINNRAAAEAEGDLLLFLNSDVDGGSPGWLAAMVEHAQRREVGAVGARLVYPDGRVQHAGVVMGLGNGVAWHPFCWCPGEQHGYLGHASVVRNWSAVTGACMLVRREVFAEMGGFDERLALCFNDVDFCLRLGGAGYRVVYTPFAELVHHESASRGRALHLPELAEMARRWPAVIGADPYFNPNLDLSSSAFRLAPLAPEPVSG